MKLIHVAAFLSVAIAAVKAGLTQYISDLPSCGLQCIVASVEASTCAITDSNCICTNKALAATINICVAQNCTVIESLKVANISNLSCGGDVPSRQNYLISTCALGIIAFLSIALRLYSRWKFERSLKADDWIMAFAALWLVVFIVLGVLAAVYGFGKNIWDVHPEDIKKALLVFWIDEAFYLGILGLCKVSLLMFYLRIFPSDNFKKACYVVLVWIVICTVIIVLLTIFQCVPVSYNWLGWTGTQKPARCTNLNAQTYASSSINIIQDVVILVLPLPWLVKLNVGWRRKLNVLLMFSIGIFILITSIIRLTKIIKFKATTNPTWDYVEPTYWSAIETYVAVFVNSLPAIRSLLSHSFPKLFSMGSQNGSRNAYEQSQPPKNSFKMKSSSQATTTTTTRSDSADRDIESADFFTNSKLELGDKMKGRVYTGITSGESQRSNTELVESRGEVIVVRTEITAEERAPSENSWLQDSPTLSRSSFETKEVKVYDSA